MRAEGSLYWKGSHIDVNKVGHQFKGHGFIPRRMFPHEDYSNQLRVILEIWSCKYYA